MNKEKIEILYTMQMTSEQKIEVFGSNQCNMAQQLDDLVLQHYTSIGEMPYTIPRYTPCVLLQNDTKIVLAMFNCVKGFPILIGDPDFVGFNCGFIPRTKEDGFIDDDDSKDLVSDLSIKRAIKTFTAPDWYNETDID